MKDIYQFWYKDNSLFSNEIEPINYMSKKCRIFSKNHILIMKYILEKPIIDTIEDS
jgi:hypothetical protein